MIVPIAAGSTRSPTAPSVSPASAGGRASRRDQLRRRCGERRDGVVERHLPRSGTSTVHGVATVVRHRRPDRRVRLRAGDWATIGPGSLRSPASAGLRGELSPTAPSTTAAAAGVRPRRSGTPARIGTATVSATPLSF